MSSSPRTTSIRAIKPAVERLSSSPSTPPSLSSDCSSPSSDGGSIAQSDLYSAPSSASQSVNNKVQGRNGWPTSVATGDNTTDLNNMFFKWRNNEAYELQVVLNPKVRRRIQNRAAQRAFRQRKEHYIKELEDKLTSVEQHRDSLMADNETLRASLSRALADNNVLLGGIQDVNSTQMESSMFINMPDIDASLFTFDDSSNGICETLRDSDISSMNFAV